MDDNHELIVTDEIIRILLIDDDEDDYVVTRDLLSEAKGLKHELQWVYTYNDALETIGRNEHDVYLLDYRLGAHTGIDLLEKVVSEGCRAPIILMTGQGDQEVDFKAMKAGAADYLVKGEINAPLLERSIRYAIERKRTEAHIYHMAYYDGLTSLPNRVLFQDRLKQAISASERHKNMTAILFLDLDNFKRVNDTLGHFWGDELLKGVAERLMSVMRKSDSVARHSCNDLFARLGGDEFTVLLNVIKEAREASKAAQRIVELLSKPFMLDGSEIFISSSIGIAIYPDDGTDVSTLLKNADAAMYHAKEHGKNNYQYYKQYMNAAAFDRLTLENDLRRAIEQDGLILYYQPQISTVNGAVIGLEALIRWQHPDKGIILPSDFIPLAEDTGLIIPISEWVLKTACRQIKAWQAEGHKIVPVSVNLSSRQFQQEDFITILSGILDESGIDPHNLILEITEGTIMQNTETVFDLLHELNEMGLLLTIDDFGTGYSSLSYLKKFPIHAIKIDRAFVSEINTNDDDAAIAMAIISMAHSLKLKVVAEGVETKDQLMMLCDQKCDAIQGYFFSPALHPENISEILEAEGRGEGIGNSLFGAIGKDAV